MSVLREKFQSKFTFTLPCRNPREYARDPDKSKEEIYSNHFFERKNENILAGRT